MAEYKPFLPDFRFIANLNFVAAYLMHLEDIGHRREIYTTNKTKQKITRKKTFKF